MVSPSTSKLTAPSPNLLDLPAEILLQIFYSSREPCLIHTCRQLRDLLPGYVSYTKSLVGLAYGPRPGQLDFCDYPEEFYFTLPLGLGHERDMMTRWTFAQRERLQQQVGTSAWLRAIHLQKTHLFCFQILLRDLLLFNRALSFNAEDAVNLESLWRQESFDIDRSIEKILSPSLGVDAILDNSALPLEKVFVNVRDYGIYWHSINDSFYTDVLHVTHIPKCLDVAEPSDAIIHLRQALVRAKVDTEAPRHEHADDE